jgi:hypothetical protein
MSVNEEFEKFWGEDCTMNDLRGLNEFQKHKRAYEAGQRQGMERDAEVEAVLEAARLRIADKDNDAYHWNLRDAIRNLDKK